MLKAGGFRSALGFFSRAKMEHLELGVPWTEGLSQAVRLSTRSVLRGIGPSRQSLGLSLGPVASLALPRDPLVVDGPCNASALILCGSYWCLREIEIAGALRSHITVRSSPRLQASWVLPCSKTDPSALGKTRCWECVCSEVPDTTCPACSMAAHVAHMDLRFPLLSDYPLFATAEGEVAEKAKVVETIEAVALRLDLPLVSEAGQRLYGGALSTGRRSTAPCCCRGAFDNGAAPREVELGRRPQVRGRDPVANFVPHLPTGGG